MGHPKLHGWSYYLGREFKQWQLRANPLGGLLTYCVQFHKLQACTGKPCLLNGALVIFLIDLQ